MRRVVHYKSNPCGTVGFSSKFSDNRSEVTCKLCQIKNVISSSVPNVPWIKEGKCTNDGTYICNLGYACDGCPYNVEGTAKAKMPKRKLRTCCACKKPKKIVNIGGPPLCKDCFPLACNWSEALQKQHEFHRNLGGFQPDTDFECGIDDVDYFLERIADDLADAHLKIRQAEVNLLNIRTTVRLDKEWEKKKNE